MISIGSPNAVVTFDGFRQALQAGEPFDVQLSIRPRRFEHRALGVDKDTTGGITAPPELVETFERRLDNPASSPVRRNARIVRRDTGNRLDVPWVDDTGNSGVWTEEGEAVAASSVSIGARHLSPRKIAAAIRFSSELLEDADFAVPQLGRLLADQIARAANSAFTTGSTPNKPGGLLTLAGGGTAGKTAASATAITPSEILDLVDTVDAAYRAEPSFGLMCHPAVLTFLYKLLETGIGWGASALATYRWIPNADMPASIAASAKTIAAGAFDQFLIHEAGDVRLETNFELYAENDEVALFAFLRCDSALLDTNAVKFLQQAAS